MTRVDFYILPEGDQQSAWDYTARLVQKIFRRGHEVFIQTADESQAQAISEALWQRPDGFLAHRIGPGDSHNRIQIAYSSANGSPDSGPEPEELGQHEDVLINLAGDIPPYFSRFARVLEIVPGRPEDRDQSRTNYQFYRSRGFSLQTHNIS